MCQDVFLKTSDVTDLPESKTYPCSDKDPPRALLPAGCGQAVGSVLENGVRPSQTRFERRLPEPRNMAPDAVEKLGPIVATGLGELL